MIQYICQNVFLLHRFSSLFSFVQQRMKKKFTLHFELSEFRWCGCINMEQRENIQPKAKRIHKSKWNESIDRKKRGWNHCYHFTIHSIYANETFLPKKYGTAQKCWHIHIDLFNEHWTMCFFQQQMPAKILCTF